MTRKQEQGEQWGVVGFAGVSVVLLIAWMCLNIPFKFALWGEISWIYAILVAAEIGYVYIYRAMVMGKFKEIYINVRDKRL